MKRRLAQDSVLTSVSSRLFASFLFLCLCAGCHAREREEREAPFLVGDWSCREPDGTLQKVPFLVSAFRVNGGGAKRRCERTVIVPEVSDPAISTGIAGAQPGGHIDVWLDGVHIVDGRAPYTGDPVHLLPAGMTGIRRLVVETESSDRAFVSPGPARLWRVGSAAALGPLVHGELVVDLVVGLLLMVLAIPIAVGAVLLARRLRHEAMTLAILAFSGLALGLIRLHDNAFHPVLGIPPFSLLAVRLPAGLLGIGALYELCRRLANPPYARPLRWGLALFAAGAFARVVAPWRGVLIVTNYVNLLIFPMGLLGAYALLKKSPKSVREWIGLSAIVVLVTAMGSRQIGLGGTTTVDYLGFANLTVFVLLAIAVALDVSGTLAQLYEEIRGKVDELATRSATIETLNVELRRQVVDKSRDLGAVLRLLPTVTTEGHRLSPGSLVGLYTVVRRLGAGGMGEVYEVLRPSDDARFALKVMSGTMSGHAAARFAREAEIAARLNHRCLVSVVDMGLGDWGGPYLVMEYVDGSCLEDLRASHFGDVAWAVEILHEVAVGLMELHAQGVVHRDLKPANILVGRGTGTVRGRVKIADFGISRIDEDLRPRGPSQDRDPASNGARQVSALAHTLAPDAQGSGTIDVNGPTLGAEGSGGGGSRDLPQLTAGGALLGTPGYMAPELYAGPATPASDVFAFGLLAWELVTGQYPFAEPPLLRAARGVPPAAAPEGPPELPVALTELLRSCLDEPSKRPTSSDIVRSLAGASLGQPATGEEGEPVVG